MDLVANKLEVLKVQHSRRRAIPANAETCTPCTYSHCRVKLADFVLLPNNTKRGCGAPCEVGSA